MFVGGNEILRYNDNVEMSVSTAPPDEHLVPGRWCGWLVYLKVLLFILSYSSAFRHGFA